jgi:hypothetical protein
MSAAGSLTSASSVALQAVGTGLTFAEPMRAIAAIAGFAFAAAVVVAGVALTYRWYFRQGLPQGITLFIGVAVVALYLNTVTLGEIVVGGGGGLFRVDSALFQVVALGAAAVVSPLGRAVGDRLATDVFAFAGARELEGELSTVVRSVGRVTAVTLPEAVEDIEEYDRVAPEVKAEIAGKTLLFPRKLTVAELRDRLVTRLKEDYGIGHVDVDLTDEGTVGYLGVGSRAAGLGPTLAPGGVAVAVRADPAHSASPGDTVQVWSPPPDPEYVLTAELRATAGDVATLAVDESEAERLAEPTRYRLATLPADPRADREFASLLRGADETMAAVTVGEDSALDGATVDDVPAAVVAIRPAGEPIVALPERSRALAAGDDVYAIARPEAIRRLESRAAAAGSDGGVDEAPEADTDAEDAR